MFHIAAVLDESNALPLTVHWKKKYMFRLCVRPSQQIFAHVIVLSSKRTQFPELARQALLQ